PTRFWPREAVNPPIRPETVASEAHSAGQLCLYLGKLELSHDRRTTVIREEACFTLRIAFVHQPWSDVTAPVKHADSVALWTDQVAHRLGKDNSVVCYCLRHPHHADASTSGGIGYRWIEPGYDKFAAKVGWKLDDFGLLPPERSSFGASWYYRHYGRRIADD